MFYIFAIILFLISFGYTWYKFNHLRFAVQKAFQDLQEGLLKIINTSDGLWGEDFQNTLKEAIHTAVEETFGLNWEVLDTMENVNLVLHIHWNSAQEMSMFDFSKWTGEKKTGAEMVGVEIWTKQNKPDDLESEDISLVVPKATLFWVKNKDEETDDNAYWIWPEQNIFLEALHEGIEDTGIEF